MARTIAQIKKEMTDEWMSDTTVRAKYGITAESPVFGDYFSKVSIESIIFYVVAVAICTLEKLMDAHLSDVESYIATMEPHTLKWYVTKAKAYRYGQSLITDTDQYSGTNATTGEAYTDSEIEAMQVVKYAACTEENAVVTLKAAAMSDSKPTALTADQLSGLASYIGKIKDAGVAITVNSQEGDSLNMTVEVWYDPSVLTYASGVLSGVSGGEPVKEAIEAYLADMPFNGELRTDSLVDAIQAVAGVEIVQLRALSSQAVGAGNYSSIDGYEIPVAGYYKLNELTINAKAYGAE
jgi:hypothetical protein